MAMPEMNPQNLEEHIVHALVKTYFIEPQQAKGVLMLVGANMMREFDQEIDAISNPYTRRRRNMLWFEGVRAVQQRLFMRELRLRTKADQSMLSRKKTSPVAPAEELPGV